MFVLTLTQRDGARKGDRVDALLAGLAPVRGTESFVRSYGDEAQGVVEDPSIVVEVALRVLRDGAGSGGDFAVGIGVGPVDGATADDEAGEEPAGSASDAQDEEAGDGASLDAPADPPAPPTGRGAARSRRAVEAASRLAVPLSVEAGPAGVTFEGMPSAPEAADAAAGALRLLGDLIRRRTEAEWAVVDLLVPGVRGQQKAVAQALGVSVQAVSQAQARARWREEADARVAAELLLGLAASAVA